MSRANNVKFRILIASAILVSILLCGLSEAASLEVTRPVKVTDSEYYERGQSIVYDGAEYWLFYGRSASEQGWYQNGNPDVNDYEVYYKTATTVAGLSVATPTKIPGLNNSNSFLGETGTAHFGSEVWTFTTIVNGGSVDLYGWYHDGANWNEVSSLSTGLSSDSAHHDETAFNGEIFVVVRRSDDFYTTHTATPKSGGWSSEVAVGSTPGRCRFFVDGSELYLAVFNGQIPGENQIFFYETGTDSWTLVASTSSDGRDPTLFKVGDDYIFAQALWIGEGGGRQFILQWANNTLDANFFVNGPTMVSEGRYDTNTWVDMWPIGFTDAGGTSYLFFTSERDIPGQEGTGNIWYLEIDWDVYSGHHTYVKEAVTASSAGDEIQIAAGTYREQLYIDKSLNLAVAGFGATILEAPNPSDRTQYQITPWTGATSDVDAIVGIVGAGSVNITEITVDGRQTGPDDFYGIHFFDSSGSVTFCQIEDILAASSPSADRIVSLFASQSTGTTFSVDFSDNVIPNFQKGGIVVMGPDASCSINRNLITNAPSDFIAGNGIQISSGATGSTSENTINGVSFTGEDWAATGILLFESGSVTMDGDEIHDCESGVEFSDWGWIHVHPDPVDLDFSNLDLHDNDYSLIAQLSRDNSDLNINLTDCEITNNAVDGIELFGTGEDPWGGSFYSGWENGDLTVTITGCNILNTSGYDGIWTDDQSGNTTNISNIAVHDTWFGSNASSAVNHNLPETMDATACYWDDPTGPLLGSKAHTTSSFSRPMISPFGDPLPKEGYRFTKEIAADKISQTIYGSVDYSPWLGLQPGSSPMDWYTDDSIQDAIDLAQSGDAVHAVAGHFEEQLYIDKSNLSISGSGAGLTFVDSPTTLTRSFSAYGNDNYPVILVENATDINFFDLTLDGLGRGSINYFFMGFGFWNSSGSLNDIHVTNIRENPLNDVYTGIAVGAFYDSGGPYSVSLTDVILDQYQSTAISGSGPNLDLDMTRVQINGAGPTDVLPQLGLDLFDQASCTITDCSIADLAYTGGLWIASGLLIYESASLNATGTTLNGCQSGISLLEGTASLDGVDVSDSPLNAIYAFSGGAKSGDADVTSRLLGRQRSLRSAKSPTSINLSDCVLTGSDAVPSYGVWGQSNGSLQIDLSECIVDHWGRGIQLEELSGSITGSVHTSILQNNISYGAWSNTTIPYNATQNWWGDALGPYHPTSNPSGLGNAVSDNVLFAPYLLGNILFSPDPIVISLADDAGGGVYQKETACRYIGGGSGLLYGYSIDITWDAAVITAAASDFTRPDTGPFQNATFFFVQTITDGVRIDAALGGAQPGTPGDDLFKTTLTAVGTPDHTTSGLALTLNYLRDRFNQQLTGFAPDHGSIIVDLIGPQLTSVSILNTTLPHTNDFIKNGDNVQVTAMVSDGHPDFGITNISADLSNLGGGSVVNPSLYDGTTASWWINNITSTPSDGTVSVVVTATDPVDNGTLGSDEITADNTPPSPLTGLTADPGHKKVNLSWDDATGYDLNYDGVVIRYAAWGDYPTYAPPEPDYPADESAGDGEGYNGTGTAAIHSFTENERDIYYYAGFVYDVARNYSLAESGGGNEARSTNYWLGDLSDGTMCGQYDGMVDVADITCLGANYLLTDIDPGFDPEADFAPTHDSGRTGIPIPDGTTDFEDLMIMAMNFGVVTPLKTPLTGSQVPALAWVQADEKIWSLSLLEPCANLKGVHLKARLPEGISVTVAAGDLVIEQEASVFLRNVGPLGLNVSLALLGTGLGIVGSGELYHVTFSAAVSPLDIEIEARGIENESFVIDPEITTAADIPTAYDLTQNYPNPFNPVTTIRFSLPENQRVRLTVFTVDGQRVATLVDEDYSAGRHEVIWDGRDDFGRTVASGTYFYRIVSGSFKKTQKMALMK